MPNNVGRVLLPEEAVFLERTLLPKRILVFRTLEEVGLIGDFLVVMHRLAVTIMTVHDLHSPLLGDIQAAGLDLTVSVN